MAITATNEIKVGRSATFTNSFGSIFTVFFRQDLVIVWCQEFRESGNGPRAEIRFSYHLHQAICVVLYHLADAIDGVESQEKPIDPTRQKDRGAVRECDYPEDKIAIVALGPDLLEVSLLGSYDHGERGGIRNGGSMPRIRVSEGETPEVFQACCRLMKAVAKDNKDRPFPKHWYI